jgi:hypothetical protein
MARLSWHGYFGRAADSGVEHVLQFLVIGLAVRPYLSSM